MIKKDILTAIEKTIGECGASSAVESFLDYDGGSGILKCGEFQIPIKEKKVFICGFGKCAAGMASGALKKLGEKIESGILLSYENSSIGGKISILKSSHPLPDANTLAASAEMVEFVKAVPEKDLLICLVSGGGSSFFEIPAPGIDFNDLPALNKSLIQSKMPIAEINIVRKAVSAVKGGRLLKHIKSSLITLAVSDTAGPDPADIASGPTWPCVIDKAAALDILKKYHIDVPAGVVYHLQNSPADCVKCSVNLNSKNNIYKVVADNAAFVKTLAGELSRKLNARAFAAGFFLTGEKGRGLDYFMDSIGKIAGEYHEDFIFAAGGEIPVSAGPAFGRGGRCQHFALGAMKILKERGLNLKKITLAAMATDGIEAFTDAAGAIFDERDLENAETESIAGHLDSADSYGFFEKNGGLIKTGATGLNVNDVFIAYCQT